APRARKGAPPIDYSRGRDKKPQLYRALLAATEASRAELQAVAAGLAETAGPAVLRWRAEVDDYLPLIARVISQTQRRVFDGEAYQPGSSWSAWSSRTPTSFSRVGGTFNTGTS